MYKCPRCGADVQHLVYLTYPPQDNYKCTKCNYENTVKRERVQMVAPEKNIHSEGK